MKKVIIVLFVAIICALSCNDQGWDQEPNPNDTIPTRDTTIIDTSGTIR